MENWNMVMLPELKLSKNNKHWNEIKRLKDSESEL